MKRDYRGKKPEGKAPLCKCGCEQPVNYYRGKWLTYKRYHSKNLHKGKSSKPDSEAPFCECLVIFKKDYKHSLHIDLFKIIKNFIKGKWSGVWNYDHLVKI